MTDAKIGHGVKFQGGDGSSPETFSDIAEVTNVGGPGLAREAVEATSSDSTNAWREYISGLRDGGEVTLTLNFLPGNATQDDSSGGLLDDLKSDDARTYRVVFPDSSNTTWEFSAFLTGYEPDVPIEDRMTLTCTFQITGEPTLGVS